MSRLAGQGAVALLELDAEATAALIAEFPGVSVAGYVSPRQTVVAGPVAPVDAVIAAVTEQDRFARRVNMEVASHTALMDPILPELRAALADLNPELPDIPFFSTVVEATTAPLLDADYWVANVRQPARLSQAVTAAAQRPRHLRRDQRSSDTDACHHRNPGIRPPPQHRHAVARR